MLKCYKISQFINFILCLFVLVWYVAMHCSPLHPEDDVPTEQLTNQTTDNNDEKYECD